MKIIFFTLTLCWLVSGCASNSAPRVGFTELPLRAGFARVYVFREKKFPGFAAKPSLSIDGQEVAMLRNGTYLSLYLRPGMHEVNAHFSILYAPIKSSKTSITVVADKELFLRFNIQMTAFVATGTIVYSEWATGFDIPEEQKSRLVIGALQPGNTNFDVLAK